jgi:hypothetical protein
MRLDKKQLEKHLDSIKKAADLISFKGLDIKRDIDVSETPQERNKKYSIKFQIYVDIDKMFKGSPSYDEKYNNTVRDLDFNLRDIGKYFNIPSQQIEIYYTYINEDFVNMICEKTQHEWYQILQKDYGIKRDALEENDFMVTLNKNFDYISDTVIIAWCNNIYQIQDFEESSLTCDLLKNMVNILFEQNGITKSGFNYHVGVCEDALT